jgi:heme A synthase
MKPRVRQVMITAALALVLAICTPVFVHRHDFDVALSRWMKDQSTENTTVLKAEARKNRWVALKAQIWAGCVAFLLLNGVWFMVRRVMHSGGPPAPKAGE